MKIFLVYISYTVKKNRKHPLLGQSMNENDQKNNISRKRIAEEKQSNSGSSLFGTLTLKDKKKLSRASGPLIIFRENEEEDRKCLEGVEACIEDQLKKGCPVAGTYLMKQGMEEA